MEGYILARKELRKKNLKIYFVLEISAWLPLLFQVIVCDSKEMEVKALLLTKKSYKKLISMQFSR